MLETLRNKALVVDDVEANRALLVMALETAGYDVAQAVDGEDAWAILTERQNDFDIVLLDRMMPRMDGMEVLRRMKDSVDLNEVPVIFQTALSDKEHIVEGIKAGAYYYLTKPIMPDVAVAIVASAIRDHRTRRDLMEKVKQFSSGVGDLISATFRTRTLVEAENLTTLLSRQCPDPDANILGLQEILVNAVEHGNLGITYEEKSALFSKGKWLDEILHRLALPENLDKAVEVSFQRDADGIEIRITDQGKGFDWRRYLELNPARATAPNGRGIFMAKGFSGFTSLEFEGKGNVVTIRINTPPA